MASVPITVLLYNGPLLCGFNVTFQGLNVYVITCMIELTAAIAASVVETKWNQSE